MARHCAEGGLKAQAITHYQRAGEQAIARLANAEAVEYFARALELLAELPESDERNQQEIGLRLAMADPQTSLGGYEDREAVSNLATVDAVLNALGQGPQQLAGLLGLSIYNTGRGDMPRAGAYANRLLEIVEPLGIAELQVAGHMIVGAAAISASPISQACTHLSNAIELAGVATLPPPVGAYDVEVLTMAHATYAIALTLSGRPEQGLVEVQASLRRGRSFDHLNTLGTALLTNSIAYYFLDDAQSCGDLAKECLDAVSGLDFHTFQSSSMVFLGWADVALGQPDGIVHVEAGIERAEGSGSRGGLVQLYFTAADAFRLAQNFDRAEEFLDRAGAAIERTGERIAFEPELPLFRAEILLDRGANDPAEIERVLRLSFVGWQTFESPWMALRSGIAWGRLAQQTGEKAEARACLIEHCNSFSEGTETPRFRQAREMVELLG
jgi:tetratricopeptide (TPR) repeat protein